MTTPRRPTLQTVADAVGVSRTTVSNAYNRPAELGAELRRRILATAEELGYPGPDPAARRLRTGTTETIGVVFTQSVTAALFDPTAVVLMRGIAAACETTALSLTLLPGDEDGGPDLVGRAAVDGFIVYSVPSTNRTVEAVRARHLPTVTVDEPRFDEPGVGYVGVADREGARSAAEHLLGLGHRDIVLLSGPSGGGAGFVEGGTMSDVSRVVRDRLDGFHTAFDAYHVAWAGVRRFVAEGNTPAAARRAAAQVLTASRLPTAVLALNDQLALAVIEEAAHRSIEVPHALSVVGFDDVPRASVVTPGLTTVRQPLFEKGRLALRMLRDDSLGAVVLPTELVVRGSTAPAVDSVEISQA